MITFLLWYVVNEFILHHDPNMVTLDTKMIIAVICIASDLNIIATLSER